MGLIQSKPRGTKPFMVLAELYTQSEEKASIQLDLLNPVAEYERERKECGSYFFLMPVDGDGTTITLFESYDSRKYMFGKHRNSAPFQKMKDLEGKYSTRSKKPLSSIISPVAGFLERKIPSGISASEQFYRVTRMKCDPKSRGDLLAALTEYSKYIRDHVNEVLSYMVALDTEDSSSLVLFERYPSEEIARTLEALERSQSTMAKLCSLDVAQDVQTHRARRGFLSKNEALI